MSSSTQPPAPVHRETIYERVGDLLYEATNDIDRLLSTTVENIGRYLEALRLNLDYLAATPTTHAQHESVEAALANVRGIREEIGGWIPQ